MDNRPIGIFDSGFGGLTALCALRKLLPNENIIYFGDTGNCPYGSKSKVQLKTLAENDLRFLKSFKVKAIIAACGTVSANCRDILDNCDIKVINVLDSSLEKLEKTLGSAAVIATEASVRSNSFRLEGRNVVQLACPEFVPLIEDGHISSSDMLLMKSVEKTLSDIKGTDNLVLGCTHYGIIKDAILKVMGENTNIIEASVCAAEKMAEYIKNSMPGEGGNTSYYTSGDIERFNLIAERIVNASGCSYKSAERAWI